MNSLASRGRAAALRAVIGGSLKSKNLEAIENKLHLERDNPADRVRSVNPCFTKGADPSGGTGAWVSFGGNRYWNRGCEIQQQFLSRSRKREDPRFKKYALITSGPRRGEIEYIPTTGSGDNTGFPLIPCQGMFREKDSAGTKAHKAIFGGKTKFPGCVPVERELEEKELISRKNTELLDYGYFLREGICREEIEEFAFIISEPAKILETRQAEVAFHHGTQRDTESWLADNKALEGLQQTIPRTSTEGFTSELLRARPSDLIRAHARKLFETEYFEAEYMGGDFKRRDPVERDRLRVEQRKSDIEAERLKSAAFLISRQLEGSKWRQQITPDFPENLRSQYCSKVHAIIKKTLPESFRRVLEFLNDLTPPQRQAIEILFMNGFDNPSQREAAAALGISKAALVERISEPVKRLELLFPELRRRNHAEQKEYERWAQQQRLIYDGCLRIETAQRIEKITRFCVKTAKPLEMNPPPRRLTKNGVARPRATLQAPRSEMRRWLARTNVYLQNRSDDPDRPYAVWKRTHADALEQHRAFALSQKRVPDESSYKIPLSHAERDQLQSAWLSLGRVKDPKCIQLPDKSAMTEKAPDRTDVSQPGLRVDLRKPEDSAAAKAARAQRAPVHLITLSI